MLDSCLLAVKGFLKRTFANALSTPSGSPNFGGVLNSGDTPKLPTERLCPLLYL
jgi:hypothetical protein